MLSDILANIFEWAVCSLRGGVLRSINEVLLHDFIRALAIAVVKATEELTKEQAIERIGVSRATFDRMVAAGIIPQGHHRRGGKRIFWYAEEIKPFVTHNK